MESIRTARKQRDMTLAQVAEKTGLSISFLSDLERGRTDPSLSSLRKLAACYDVPVASLLEETEYPTPEDIRGIAFTGFVASGALELEQRIAEMAERQTEMEQGLAEVQQLVDQLKRKQIKAGPLGSLAKALAYHHKTVNGWAYLASEGDKLECTPENLQRLHTEFSKIREVVTQYEYVAQVLLGINPSPMADLEDKV